MTKAYDESHITGFTRDLQKIQARPNMYIGPTDADGIYTILREACDNAVDEARAGRNAYVSVHLDAKGFFWVIDRGVGIPVKMHPTMKISTLTHVLTNLQSSGKMKGDAYKHSIGTHGVGVKATNALSTEFEVWTYRDDAGGWHHTSFAKGKETEKVTKSKAPKTPEGTPKLGTVIRFKPDTKFFGAHKISLKQVALWCEMTSYMNSGLELKLTAQGKTKTWKTKDGIKSYLAKRIEAMKATPFTKKVLSINSERIELALVFADVEGPQVEFFTNTVRNVEGGVHRDDLYRALFDSMKPFMKVKEVREKTKVKGKVKTKTSKEYPCKAEDIRDGLIGLLNYKVNAPLFNGQTKEKLVDDRVKGACYDECMASFAEFWKENSKLAKDLVARATLLRSKTADFLKDKNLVKNVNAARKGVVTKLAAVVGNAPVEKRELFLVEGDSAGGGLKRARDKSYQAVYPMRGKPLNVMNATKEQINQNAEVVGLLAGLGVDLSGKSANATIGYGKVVSMADPDVDGKHINCMTLAILWKYMPHLFKQGVVYVVKAPLYKGSYKGKVAFGMTKDQLFKRMGTDKCDVSYVKGWGEINEEDLGIAVDPEHRTLYKVLPPDAKEAQEFQLLLGKAPAYRKVLLNVA